MVVRLEGVQWEPDGGSPPSEGDLLPVGRFRFRAGRATLAMLTGVQLVVEGPADLEFVSVERVLCHRGRLRARVPAGAEGFIVSGSGSAVIDLGTEFGMNVEPDGTMRGRVFEGRVEAAVLNESGTLQRSRMMREKSNTFAIDPRNGLIESGTRPDEFISSPHWPPRRSPSIPATGRPSWRRSRGATGGSRRWPMARSRTRSPAVPRSGRSAASG